MDKVTPRTNKMVWRGGQEGDGKEGALPGAGQMGKDDRLGREMAHRVGESGRNKIVIRRRRESPDG